MRSTVITALFLLWIGSTFADTGGCLDCHDAGDDGPVHALMQTAHGALPESCEACHGPSLEHRNRPTGISPDVSYGPRWTANTAEQDGSCLGCHQANVAKHWNEALHMVNNVTCASCHRSHDAAQDLSVASQQAETCTICHKTQKAGIHGKENMLRMNPPCTQCHNPHADQRPVGVMLANDSRGCRRCHNLDAMAKSDRVSARAKGFHRVMETGDRTCVDCHQGVAHGDTESLEPFLPLPRSEGDITLFFPGQSDADWLLTQHPGSQPLRQGSNCRQCHRGEEADMGAALGGEPPSRQVSVAFQTDGEELVASLTWQGSEDDTTISMMWGFGNDEPFRRGGCWAACHGDMAGMSLDRGTGKGKYLWSALEQRRQIGQQAVYKSDADLAETLRSGRFVELWQLDLGTGRARSGTVLEDIQWLDSSTLTGTVSHSEGRWTAEIRRPLDGSAPLRPLEANRRYTFGVALHDGAHRAGAHWVSLPMTLSVDRDDTDFITR
jgi:predicted CXXCH cytochrome family protein